MDVLKLTRIKKLPDNPYGALTLAPEYIGKHDDGWEIVGDIHEDYYVWVNRFVAYKHGRGDEEIVCGDFEEAVYATSQKAYDEFISTYPPDAWDYADI